MSTITSRLPSSTSGFHHTGSTKPSQHLFSPGTSSITELRAQYADHPSCVPFSVCPSTLTPDGDHSHSEASNILVSPTIVLRSSEVHQVSGQAASSSSTVRNSLIQLELEDNSEDRHLALRRAARRVLDAEDRVSNRRKATISALRESARLSHEAGIMEYRSYYQAHGRLAVARANQETLMAQNKLARKRIRAAKLRLQASYEAAEAVATQLMLAERDLGAIMTEMSASGWMTNPAATRPSNQLATQSRPWPQEPWSSDSESEGSDMEYEAGPDSEVEGYGD